MKIVLTESQISKILTEGKLEDLLQKYEEKYGRKYTWDINTIYDEDPTPTKKYFTWVVKVFVDREQKGLKTDSEDLFSMINYFDTHPHKFEKKDIYQYTYDEFVNKYEDAISKFTKKELQISGVDKLYGNENDRYILVRPKNKEASCKYGSNTKWCIASNSNNYFENYSDDNLFFFVIDRERIPIEGSKKSPDYFKVAIQYQPSKHNLIDQLKTKNPKTYEKNKLFFLKKSQQGEITFWNSKDIAIKKQTVEKYIPRELINNFINIIKEYTYKVYSDYFDKIEKDYLSFDFEKLQALKKLTKEKKLTYEEAEYNYENSDSWMFINNINEQLSNLEWLVDEFDLTAKTTEDFINFLGIKERYYEENEKVIKLGKIKNDTYNDWQTTKAEYNQMSKQYEKFKNAPDLT